MAESQNGNEETSQGEGPAKKKLKLKPIIMIGGWVLGQIIFVVVVFWLFKSATQTPTPVEAREVEGAPQLVEIPINPSDPENKIKAVNTQTGRMVCWMLKVYLQVPKDQANHVAEQLKVNQNFVRQEILTIVGSCPPAILEQEADHATLKRQIRYALNKVLGKGTVNAVLISECIPAPLD